MSGTGRWKLIRDTRLGSDKERIESARQVFEDQLREVERIESNAKADDDAPRLDSEFDGTWN